MNLYQYALNNPTNFVDPTGENILEIGGGLLVIWLAVLIYSPRFGQSQTCPPTQIEIPDWITDLIAVIVPLVGPLLGVPPIVPLIGPFLGIPPVLLAHGPKKQSTGSKKKNLPKHQKNHPGRGMIPWGKLKKILEGKWNQR